MNINIIETMKQACGALVQCQQQLSSDWTHFTTATEAITNLCAAIDAAEKQEPEIVRIGEKDYVTSGGYLMGEVQPDSEQVKIGCIGHDGECCKDREQVYLDAEWYRKECDQLKKLWFDDVDPAETKYADEYAAMKVGAGETATEGHAIGQGSNACGASPAPTGCAANGTNDERTDK